MNRAIKQVASLLLEHDQILILTHKNPDGDTLGSGFGLYYALRQLGKQAYVANSDSIPDKYLYMVPDDYTLDFEPSFVVSVDVADTALLGDALAHYADSIDLCVDHHASNSVGGVLYVCLLYTSRCV